MALFEGDDVMVNGNQPTVVDSIIKRPAMWKRDMPWRHDGLGYSLYIFVKLWIYNTSQEL